MSVQEVRNLIGENLPVLRAAALVIIGLPLVQILAGRLRRVAARKVGAQFGLVAGKIVRYAGVGIITVSVFQQLEFPLTPLLGAAGIVGVAFAYASRTSMANVISGVFLMIERSFVVGDYINVGDSSGTVLSIDILSVKIRTSDNCFIRIPNESILDGHVVNYSRYSTRRVDVQFYVAIKEDLEKVKEVLLDLAKGNPHGLSDPEPQVYFTGLDDRGSAVLLAVWAQAADYSLLRDSLYAGVTKRFGAEGIEISVRRMPV